MAKWGDIANLAGHINEPYRVNQVIEAAKGLQPPFLLREIVDAAGLPRHVCQRVLSRLVKQKRATRFKVRAAFPTVTGAGNKGLRPVRWIPGGRIRSVYAYTLAPGE